MTVLHRPHHRLPVDIGSIFLIGLCLFVMLIWFATMLRDCSRILAPWVMTP